MALTDAAIVQLQTTLGRFQSATWQDTGSEDREHLCLLVSQQIRLGTTKAQVGIPRAKLLLGQWQH